MVSDRLVEYIFFFGFLGLVAFIVWLMMEPFVSSLALASIIVTICYPLHTRICKYMPKHNRTLASLASTLVVLVLIICPIVYLISVLINETLVVYGIVSDKSVGFEQSLNSIESMLEPYIPGLHLNVADYVKQATTWLAGNVGAIFAGTASTIFSFFIAIIGSFYLFRDGADFTRRLIKLSPLPDDKDELILARLAQAVRSVATGTVLIAFIQGLLTALGLWLFGIERPIVWGLVAAFGALLPSIGTSIVFIPAVFYLFWSGDLVNAIGLAIWGAIIVGTIDNLLGPYLMSRDNHLHPFIVLVAVLGGITIFGPIGFIVGPVVVSLFIVLLELYTQYIARPVDQQ